jgi:hypothetical protein
VVVLVPAPVPVLMVVPVSVLCRGKTTNYFKVKGGVGLVNWKGSSPATALRHTRRGQTASP